MSRRRSYRTLLGQLVALDVAGTEAPAVPFTLVTVDDTLAQARPADPQARAWPANRTAGETIVVGAAEHTAYLRDTAVVERWVAAERLLVFRFHEGLEVMQRRETFRVPVALELEVRWAIRGGLATVSGSTLNLSETGCAVAVEGLPPSGTDVLMTLAGVDDEPILIGAQVLEADDRRGRLRFDQLSGLDQRRLMAAVRAAERMRARTGLASGIR